MDSTDSPAVAAGPPVPVPLAAPLHVIAGETKPDGTPVVVPLQVEGMVPPKVREVICSPEQARKLNSKMPKGYALEPVLRADAKKKITNASPEELPSKRRRKEIKYDELTSYKKKVSHSPRSVGFVFLLSTSNCNLC